MSRTKCGAAEVLRMRLWVVIIGFFDCIVKVAEFMQLIPPGYELITGAYMLGFIHGCIPKKTAE